MDNLMNFAASILMLHMITDLVTTPEMREHWRQEADWDHYASRYID